MSNEDFTVVSNSEARRLAALEHFFRQITTRASSNGYSGQDGLRLVEIRNILEEMPADVLADLSADLPGRRPMTLGEILPGTHEF